MKGNIGIYVVVAIIALGLIGFSVYQMFLSDSKMASPTPSVNTSGALSEDPKYQDVKEKYNLSEEQLQILSTVNPNDND